jgi:tripartite-type tricarboxylate transporter receptor subunit TctC
MLKHEAKIDITYVPFPGNAPTINATLGGHVTAGVANYADVIEHLKAGKLRALATVTPIRIESLPEVPTVAESDYKEFEYEVWFGLFASARTPKEMLSQFASWYTAAMHFLTSRQSFSSRDSIRLERAARPSANLLESSMTITAASSARPTSRPNDVRESLRLRDPCAPRWGRLDASRACCGIETAGSAAPDSSTPLRS